MVCDPAGRRGADLLIAGDESWCFALGPHRSGTTIVTRLLAESGAFVYLTPADIVARLPDGDERKAELRRLVDGGSTRLIDDVRITDTLPEEYGFLFPQRGLSAERAAQVASIHRELARDRGAPPRFLARNPMDLSRVALIDERFPRTSFVFIVRDPVETIDSQLQAARTLHRTPSEYQALLAPSYQRQVRRRGASFRLARFLLSRPRTVDWMLRSFVRHTGRWMRALDSLPGERWTVVRYEDLLDRPFDELTRLYRFLDLPLAEIPRLAGEIRPRGRSLDRHVTARIGKIRKRTAAFRERFGY